MRWYRQHARELLRNEGADLVSLPDKKVVHARHRRDARVGHGRAELVGGAELVVLRRDDERALWDRRQRARCEAHILRADADERDGVGAAAPREVREDLERTEAVPDETERKARSDRTGVVDRRGDVVGLVPTAGPLSRARAYPGRAWAMTTIAVGSTSGMRRVASSRSSMRRASSRTHEVCGNRTRRAAV